MFFVTLKLLNPDFERFEKCIYWANIMVKSKTYGWYPLEFISRKEYVSSLLNDIESKLIFELQPMFNVYKKKVERTRSTFKMETDLPFEQVKFIDQDRKAAGHKLFVNLRRVSKTDFEALTLKPYSCLT